MYIRAHLESQLSGQQAAALAAQLAAAGGASEHYAALWQAAEHARAASARAAGQREAQAATHMVERLAAQVGLLLVALAAAR
jgi:hypothetical protein